MPAEREGLPFGAAEILAALEGAARVLDAGCGSGRVAIALAQAGAAVWGIDTSRERLAQARERVSQAGVELSLCEADFDAALPFEAGSFDAAMSRLALMAAADPGSSLRELSRVVVAGGRIVTALWASPAENPWFAEPRAAAASALGPERASFARAFGRLGEVDEAAQAHREAGLVDVVAQTVRGELRAPTAAAHWQHMVARIGHFTRLDAALEPGERDRTIGELDERLARFAIDGEIVLPRTQVLVSARVPATTA